MVLRAKLLGRVELTNKIRKIAPKAIEKMDEVKLQVAEEAAAAIKARAPRLSGDYAESIRAGLQSDNPDKIVFGAKKSKDPTAVGVYANFIWRFIEFGTKASGAQAPRADRRYKSGKVMTKGSQAHGATPAQPHIFPVWRGMRKKAMSRIRNAMNKGIREALKTR
ncbi:HK97 gp10 family phage protein [Brucella pseudogrignonensis]|uniref:HK97 gp10 family phage protein n=1 Tax=Brucella pseudogrignonensis TaxID=419475 RepID=UPI003D97B8F2